MKSSGYSRVTAVTNSDIERMTSSGYGRVTAVTNSDIERMTSSGYVVLLLSQTRTLRNEKQWLRSCYCCHKLGHRVCDNSNTTVATAFHSSMSEFVTTVTRP
jgi:hypothetical protein